MARRKQPWLIGQLALLRSDDTRLRIQMCAVIPISEFGKHISIIVYM